MILLPVQYKYFIPVAETDLSFAPKPSALMLIFCYKNNRGCFDITIPDETKRFVSRSRLAELIIYVSKNHAGTEKGREKTAGRYVQETRHKDLYTVKDNG